MSIYEGKKITMSSRVNPKVIATIVKWMQKEGVEIPKRGQQSWLVNFVFETFVHNLIRQGEVVGTHDLDEALEVLGEAGIHFSKDSKPMKDIREIQIEEILEKEKRKEIESDPDVRDYVLGVDSEQDDYKARTIAIQIARDLYDIKIPSDLATEDIAGFIEEEMAKRKKGKTEGIKPGADKAGKSGKTHSEIAGLPFTLPKDDNDEDY